MSTDTSCAINYKKVDDIIASIGAKKQNLIAILQKVQEEFSFLPQESIAYIGTKIDGLSTAEVQGVATVYAQFSLEPKGKYEIKCCDGTACHVRGSMPVYTYLTQRFNLEEGKFTSKDGLFSVETVSCLGACGLAPVVVINGKVYPQMTTDAIKIVIDTLVEKEQEG